MEPDGFWGKLSYTPMLISPLNLYSHRLRLRQRLLEIDGHLHRFDQTLAASQQTYKRAQARLTDPALQSALLEAHTIQMNQQWHIIESMQALRQKVLDRLSALESRAL